jgi:outer membrane protein
VTAQPGDTSDVAPIGMSDAELMNLAVDGPTVRQSAANLSAAQATQRAAQAPYYPTLTMNMSYGKTPPQTDFFKFGGGEGQSTTSTQLGFTLNYTLFNNYTREASIVSARVGMDNAEANLRDAKFLQQQNLTTQINTFRTAMLSIELSKLNIVAGVENLRVVQQQYNLGTKQLLDLLTAQSTLDNSRATLIANRQSARLAKANIESLIGRDLK